MRRPRQQSGVSLIECCMVSALVATVVSAALPSFEEVRQRRLLEGAAAQLETDLQLARAEAVARSESVRVVFARDESGSCYTLWAGDHQPVGCSASDNAIRQVRVQAGSGLQVSANVGTMRFDPTVGTVTPTATVALASRAGRVHLVVNVMGRIRTCTPDGAIPGVARC